MVLGGTVDMLDVGMRLVGVGVIGVRSVSVLARGSIVGMHREIHMSDFRLRNIGMFILIRMFTPGRGIVMGNVLMSNIFVRDIGVKDFLADDSGRFPGGQRFGAGSRITHQLFQPGCRALSGWPIKDVHRADAGLLIPPQSPILRGQIAAGG